eukprot:CAMPEP_0116006526 /NCGR_PEP_ID=MMETSP0321-20121206/1779_1 /TAXON_ID=163516 /ORGANISM="Leptocylindrus danicus var. danicus, Strain B650" /LENGTH=259 /DNA_ID=CAMNT_0003475093 /DNA_START=64 /DNA_END=843 /DNA_ORIENTATION=-
MAEVISDPSEQDFESLMKDIGHELLSSSNTVPTSTITSFPSRTTDGISLTNKSRYRDTGTSPSINAMVHFRGNGLVTMSNNCTSTYRHNQQYNTRRAPEGYSKLAEMRQMMDKNTSPSNASSTHTRIRSNINGSSALATIAPSAGNRRKCTGVYIGGTHDVGYSNALKRTACSRLRCTKCNYIVTRFYGKAWTRVDYLFFRNNMGDAAKLRERMMDETSSVSYCCQCSWATATSLRRVHDLKADGKQIHWVCAGHRNGV